jgi:drug/metabolite transporter (DMT)-like permease
VPVKHYYWIAPTFIFLWSTGFIIAKYGMPYTDPLTFLSMRFVGVLIILIPATFIFKSIWPAPRQMGHIVVAGLLMQFVYLSGIWEAVKHGMPAGLAALIIGLQPVLTAVCAAGIAEKVSHRQWLGLALGLVGVGIVLSDKISVAGVTLFTLGFTLISLLAFTAGTLYQKKFCPVFDLRTGTIIQYGASAVVSIILMFWLEPMKVQWSIPMVSALLWSIGPISLGAMTLWFVLLRSGAATKASSLLYLTPPTTAIMAWVLFDELLTPTIMMGTAVTVAGVYLVTRTRRSF